jgi:hypothetical protein
MPGNLITPMSRPALLILRVLAVGGALTVLACHVVRRQQDATAGASGERGTAGANAVQAPAPVRMSGTKSLGPAPGALPGVPENPPSASAPAGPDVIIVGTKSAPVLNPADVKPLLPNPVPPAAPAPQPPVRSAIPSTKSARMITPSEVQRFKLPATQQSATPQP